MIKTGFSPIRRLAILIVLLSSVFTEGFAQTITINGQVRDADSKEPIAGAYVFTKEPPHGTTTDSLGRYKLTVQPGQYIITASYVGYAPMSKSVSTDGYLQVDFFLEANTLIDPVTISSQSPDRNITDTHMGLDRFSVRDIRKMPTLLGEADPLRSIQMLPGVQATSEGSTGFSVRGGAPDQNLILLDNTTVYNASHLLGFFSVFNNDVIRGVELYKGDIPMRYGGRLSSLLNVNTKNDIPERFKGTGGIGLISSRLTLEGPIGDKTSWLVSGRRSYADAFLVFAKDEQLRKTSVYFYDANAKFSHRFSLKDMIEFNGYLGSDHYGAEGAAFDYGNVAASLSWRHIFNDNLLLRTSVNYSDYSYDLMSEMEGFELNWKSGIRDIMMRADMEHKVNDYFNLTYGLTSTFHRFNPGVGYIEGLHDVEITKNYALETALYISNEQTLFDRLTLRYGLRFNIFNNIGPGTVYQYDSEYNPVGENSYGRGSVYNTYTGWEPRAGLVFRLTDVSSLKGSFSRNVQYIQLANNSASGTPLDVWFAAGPNIEPQTVNSWSAGYFHNFGDNAFETSVEAYYKDMDNVIDFKEHANLMMNQYLDGEIRTGTGQAYGIEFMVRKNSGKLNGFVNYTLSRSERTIPGINDGKTYLAPYDKTHAVNVMLNYDFSEQWSASAIWIYATGNPTTYPVGRFIINGEIFPIYSERNAGRFPDYHRLDLSVTYRPKRAASKRWRGEWNLSVYNAYNKKNPWTISFRQEPNGTPDAGKPYAEMIYLFGIVPSISYNFIF